ncbi:MAG: S-layer homology domain-containing protein [Bacillota bacterium]|nr:S-layer homology domain-containing protein [Bacillota bacterium]
MKKVLSLMLSLLLLVVFSGSALANPGNGNAHSKEAAKNQKKVLQQGVEPSQKAQTVRQIVKQQITVKKQLKEEYRAKVQTLKQERAALQFKDCEQHWASESIGLLSAAGLFNGYPDGSFQPDKSITQAESIALVMRLAEDEETEQDEVQSEDADINQTDTDSDDAIDEEDLDEVPAWARQSAGKAARRGFVNINRFHSAVQASRAQTAVWIAKAVGLEPVDTSKMPFVDGLMISAEDAGYIMALYQEGFIQGTPSGKFNPNSAITRAEMATIMQRILEEQAIKSITLSEESITVEQGESITLKATVNYADGSSDNNVSWSTDDAELAAVEDGVITTADDQTGIVTITATATQDDVFMSANCEITVVEKIEVLSATLKATDAINVNEGTVYEEYALEAEGETIPLDADHVAKITLTQGDGSPVILTPNTDTTLWFDVQKESASNCLNVEDNNGILYEATLDWTAPQELKAVLTGNKGENEGNQYVEYAIGDLDLSSFTKMYQVKPDAAVAELTANSDSTLWFKTNDQQTGDHTFLIKQDGTWYSTTITFVEPAEETKTL